MSELSGNATTLSADQERGRRDMLAAAIERRLKDIEARWLRTVQDELSGRHDVSPTDLRNAIGDYVLRLARALRGAASIESEGTSAWADIAREHALTRVRLGFDIDHLVREFILLRRVLSEIAREEHIVSNDMQHERLADLIDAAIARAVKSYTESRDLATRQQQAEHIGFWLS